MKNYLIGEHTKIYSHNPYEIYRLYSLFSLSLSKEHKKDIKDYLWAESMRFQGMSEYREGTKKYIEQQEEKAKIKAIKDRNINIKECGSVKVFDKRFNICCYTGKEIKTVDYDIEDYPILKEVEIKIYFLENRNYNNIYTFSELISLDIVQKKLFKHEVHSRVIHLTSESAWPRDNVLKYFKILRHEITEALKKGCDDFSYNHYSVSIGKKAYTYEYLNKVIAAKYYWDEYDEKKEFGRDYFYESRLEEYEKYKDSVIV